MKRKKLWYLNDKQQLYPLLSTESIFHNFSIIKQEAQRMTGTSTIQINDTYKHYVIMNKQFSIPNDIIPLQSDSSLDLSNKESIIKRLKQFGLHTYKRLPDERLFLFRMVHLKAWTWTRVSTHINVIGKIYIVERNSADLIIHNDEVLSEIILRQAEIIAARALYAVGLDIGSVLIAVSGTGTIAVRKVYTLEQDVLQDDEPDIKQAMRIWQLNRARSSQVNDTIQLHKANIAMPKTSHKNKTKPLILSKKVLQMKKEVIYYEPDHDEMIHFEKNHEPFLYDQFPELWMGADPELVFINEANEIVPAVDVLLDDPSGRYGFDSVISEQKVTFPVAEIRPDPQQTPEALFNEIETIIHDMGQYGIDQQYQWLAGGMPRGLIALGGHLHFSGVEITSRLLKMLDSCLGLTFSLVEDKLSAELRRKKYGALGDFRRQEHGGFEYRTLPSWLVSPTLTKAALALSYIVIKDREHLIKLWHVDGEQFDAYNNNNVNYIRERVNEMFDVLEQLPNYPEVKDWIIPLKYMIKVGKRWNESTDIRLSWKVLAQV